MLKAVFIIFDSDYKSLNNVLSDDIFDISDSYNSEAHSSEVFLPSIKRTERQYIGFFHTGAYQDSLGGYGGIQHCLIPAPKHLILDKNEQGELSSYLFFEEQQSEGMMKILGYSQINLEKLYNPLFWIYYPKAICLRIYNPTLKKYLIHQKRVANSQTLTFRLQT